MKKNLRLISVLFLWGVVINAAHGQKKEIDSLLTLVKKDKEDTNKVNHLNLLAWDLMNTNPDSAIFVGKQSLVLSEKLQWKQGIASSLGRLGVYYWNKADYPKALEYDFKALKMNEELGYKDRAAANLSNIGIIYGKQADYPKALYYYFKSLKIGEELGNKEANANNLMNIGIVYKEQENDSKALYYYFKAMKIYEELGNKRGIATTLSNMGNVYKGQREYSKAMDHYSRALKIKEELGNKKGIATTLSNMGSLYMLTGKFKESEENIKKAISIASALDIKKELREFEGNLSRLYDTTAQLAVRNGQFAIAAENYKLSMVHYKKVVAIKDTLFNMEKSKEITRKEMNYEFEKKEAVTKAEQEKKDLLAKKEIQKQKLIRNGLLAGFGLVLIFAGIFFNQRNKIKKGKKISDELLKSVSKQKVEVEKQKNIVEFQNKEILSSIEYAKRIQATILPPLKVVEKHLEDSFVLYLPKDIVAGDFYWMENIEQEEGLVLIAACDCTGHGVPGALVSVVCSNALNRAVKENSITEPGLILDKVAELVVHDFSKDENENVQDGMDASLCALNTKTGKIQWAGANNPLFLISDGKLIEIKGDKQPIGKIDNLHPFKTNYIDTKKGDTFYLFTDGYSDQFGGQENRKFTKMKFKELLLSIQHLNMHEQRNYLYEFHNSYKN